MRKIKMSKDTVVNTELIEKLIENHQAERSRILEMKDYYNNKNTKIMNREYSDPLKPSNRLCNGYARSTTDFFVGYFLGNKISYKSDNEPLMEALNLNFLYNDEVDNNTTLGQEISVCGYAYELMYRDAEANARFKVVDTEEMIVVYENTLEEKELFAIRYVSDAEGKGTCYVYTLDNEEAYTLEKGKLGTLIYSAPNYFNQVQVCTYENNKERMGDFEVGITHIDVIDQLQSDRINDQEYFTNALLVVSGVVMEDENNPLNFKDNRVLNFADTTSKAEYLIKNVNNAEIESLIKRVEENYYKTVGIPNMSDENFGANLSGISLKFKFTDCENRTSIKESKFKKGLMKRIELLVSYLGIKTNTDFTYTEITPVFTRNMPSNDVEIINTIKGLVGTELASMDTLRSHIPIVEDAIKEKEAIEKEKEEMFDSYDNFDKEVIVNE